MNVARDELESLAGIYQLLARLWIREVDEQLLSFLVVPPLRDVFTAAGGILPQNVAASTLEELAMDYCQLFLGPANHLPPYQSVWQHGQFQNEPAESMRHYVSAADYGTGGLMFDHLGVQLDVMGRLLDRGQESIPHADHVCGLAGTYFAEHLTWVAPLFEFSINRAATDFYRSMVRMTRDFLKSEEKTWAAAPLSPNLRKRT